MLFFCYVFFSYASFGPSSNVCLCIILIFCILDDNFDYFKSFGWKGLNLFEIARNNISNARKIIDDNLQCLLLNMKIVASLLSILAEIFDNCNNNNNNNNNDSIFAYLANIERQSNNLIDNIKSKMTISNNNSNNNNKEERKHLHKKVAKLPNNNLYYTHFPYNIRWTSFCRRSNDYSLSKLNSRSQKNIIIGGYNRNETEFYELELDKNENGEKCLCYYKFNDKYKSGIQIVCNYTILYFSNTKNYIL